jgi:hypothetical protein
MTAPACQWGSAPFAPLELVATLAASVGEAG